MKLYKYMSAKSAYDYLHKGGVEVKPCDTHYGVISFSTEPWSTSGLINPSGVVLEFDKSADFILPRRGYSWDGDKVMQIELACCERTDSSYLYKIGDELRLDSFTLAPDCQIGWKFVRFSLRKIGKDNVGIRLLMWQNGNRTPYRDEEYRPSEQGLLRLKYNPNHPHVYDSSHVDDVEFDYTCRVSNGEKTNRRS